MSYYKDTFMKKIMDNTLSEFKSLGAYTYHVSKHGSCYVKFKNERLRSVRIADHDGRPWYRYKWNLVSHRPTEVVRDNGVVRYFYNIIDFNKFVSHVKNYSNALEKE